MVVEVLLHYLAYGFSIFMFHISLCLSFNRTFYPSVCIRYTYLVLCVYVCTCMYTHLSIHLSPSLSLPYLLLLLMPAPLYACMHVCRHVCMRGRMCVYISRYIGMSVRMYVCGCGHTCVSRYRCIDMYVLQVCMYGSYVSVKLTCEYVCIYTWLITCLCMYRWVHVRSWLSIDIYIYISLSLSLLFLLEPLHRNV